MKTALVLSLVANLLALVLLIAAHHKLMTLAAYVPTNTTARLVCRTDGVKTICHHVTEPPEWARGVVPDPDAPQVRP